MNVSGGFFNRSASNRPRKAYVQAGGGFGDASMTVLMAGVALLGMVLGVFWWKDRTDRLWVARLAYSRFTARLAVLGAALAGVGALMVLQSLFDLGAGGG